MTVADCQNIDDIAVHIVGFIDTPANKLGLLH